MTDADIFALAEALDERMPHGGDRGNQYMDAKGSPEPLAETSGRTAVTTAKTIGTSPAKIKKFRNIKDHAPADILSAVCRIYQVEAYHHSQWERQFDFSHKNS